MEIKDFSKLIKHSVSQEGRFLEALDFEYVKIDERSFEDLLRFVYGFSKLIKFYNLENQPDGDWSEFINDETVILATIKQTEPTEIETRFRAYIEKANLFKRTEKKAFYLQKCFTEIYQIAIMFENWLSKFKEIEMFANVQLRARNEILNAIETKLSAALIQLKTLDIAASQLFGKENFGLDYQVFNVSWQLSKADKLKPDLDGETLTDKVRYLSFDLERIFQTFYESLVFLKSQAENYLQQSLQNANHYPSVALILAFLRIFEYSQTHLNDLSRRYLEFYYRTVLQEDFKTPVNDQVYLSFTTNDNALYALVSQGTQFIAGEYENGDNILYQANQDLMVNKAQIARLLTVFLEENMLNIRGRTKLLVNNTLFNALPLAEISPNPELQEKKAYPIFGESQSQKSIYERTMQNAEVGFAVASPAFYLSEGIREVSLTFVFEPESYLHLTQYLSDLSFITGDSPSEVFIKSFLEAFRLEITAPEGWHALNKYVITQKKYPENSNSFSALNIRFDIAAQEPAWVSYDAKVHQHNFQTELPIIRLMLNSEAYIYPYSLLKELVLSQIIIDTHVKEVKNIQLFSDIGVLDATNPFYPFGSVPNVGSYLVIGANEIFQKSLNDLSINIEWFNLPREASGFVGYYEDYKADIDNTSFEVKLSILEGGRWKPAQSEAQQTFKLFRTKQAGLSEDKPDDFVVHNGQLSPFTQLSNIDMVRIKLPHNYTEIKKVQTYTNTSKRGFLKLELANPAFAFGHTLYPSVLSEIVAQNAQTGIFSAVKRGFAKKVNKKMPNPAYTPQMKSISLNYSSSSVISLTDHAQQNQSQQRGQFYHEYPFGVNLAYPNAAQLNINLLPSFNYQGALLIGLKDLAPPQNITLLLEMAEGISNSSEESAPVIEWSYLANDQWFALSASKILNDDTLGFVKTGLIEVEIPRNIQKGNTILDSALYWLRIAAVQNVSNASKITSICTQVLKATLVNLDEDGKHLEQALPAFTIERSVDSLPGIQRIMQPMPSFGGSPKEKTKQFYTRLSERLRHKQRAITAWDYERLILECFPQIQKATCLSNMNSERTDQAGSVLIVVTPYSKDKKTIDPLVSREQLYEIKDYLQQYTSPFVQLEVRNPAYERVKIICGVQLAKGYNYGLYLQKLNDEINKYLIQDMLQNGKNIELGGKINTSDILSFMRTLPYIDFITRFSMVQTAQDFQGDFILLDTAREGDAKSFLRATKPWSALIPAEQHQITLINNREEMNAMQAGISDLGLGDEFIIED